MRWMFSGALVCLSAIKMEGEDAPGGSLFFKAIDARGFADGFEACFDNRFDGATVGSQRVGMENSSDDRSHLFL